MKVTKQMEKYIIKVIDNKLDEIYPNLKKGDEVRKTVKSATLHGIELRGENEIVLRALGLAIEDVQKARAANE